jgi:HK97 family phage major capsid protein/HK97 family phage prohead protease
MNPTGVQALPSEDHPVEENMERDAELQQLRRYQPVQFERAVDNERTFTFPFSSEFPVQRAFGSEVLSHDRGAADLSRMNDGAPLLFNHDPGKVIGVVERSWIDEKAKRGYATVRFSRSAFAQEIMADVKDGVLRNVSFGYAINNMEERGGDYVATAWAPYEVSVVSIPADPTVGVGRALDAQPAASAAPHPPQMETEVPKMDNTPDLAVVRAEAAEAERSRIAGISALCDKHGMVDLGRQMVESGRSLDEVRAVVLERMGAKQEPIEKGTGTVELNQKEQRDYSVVRAINAAITGNWKDAGLEREVSAEIERQTGRSTSGFFMPHNLQMERAPYAVGSATTGGNLVATNLLASSFIDVLRNNALIMQMGPTVLSGLVGNVAIPRQTAATQTYWVTEASALTEAEATFDQVTLSPKQIGARSQYSRLALQQTTPDIEQIVRNDLAKVMALGIDKAAISGTGSSGQPTGILNTGSIGSVAMGTNGAAFTDSASGSTSGLDQLIALEGKLDVANALNGNLYYLTNAKVVQALKKLKTAYGEYLWTDMDGVTTSGTPGGVNGYTVMRSNQVPSNLTKGSGSNLSALLFGDFSQLVIGMWGALEILPNPYGSGYTAGSVDIRAMQTCDIAVRHAESFAAITDIIA